MIRINKPDQEPAILEQNKEHWTKNLLNAVIRYGNFSNIPKEEKRCLTRNYRHSDIQQTLSDCSNEKCAFCEAIPGESGNLEIDHFHPISIYPEETFEWANLIPACRKCNEAKSNHDTTTYPIVNPCNCDPEDYFAYNDIKIISSDSSPDTSISERTINVCGLNTLRLFKSRANLLVDLRKYEKNLTNHLDDIIECNTERKRNNMLQRIRESIAVIDGLTYETEKYSAFCKQFIKRAGIYQVALQLLDDFGRSQYS